MEDVKILIDNDAGIEYTESLEKSLNTLDQNKD